MTSLLHHGLPPLVEAHKDRAPDRITVEGAAVAHAELVRALLRHGSFDRYYFTCDAEDDLESATERLRAYSDDPRARVIPVERVNELRDTDRMILLKNSLLVVELCALRRWSGRARWPITGLTHSLSYLKNVGFSLFSLAWLFEDIRRHDCLVCTTRSAERVYHQMLASAVDYVSRRLGVDMTPVARTAVIPLGVDTERYRAIGRAEARAALDIPTDRFVVLSLGRLSPESKADPIPLLLAFKALHARRGKARLVLAGDDTRSRAAEQLRELAGTLGLGDALRIAPNLTFEQKCLHYAAADVFVSLSDNVQETFGLTVVEAMSMGLPVITSDWDGYRETVVHEETGLRIPTRWLDVVDDLGQFASLRQDAFTHRQLSYSVSFDVEAVAQAMETLSDQPALRQQMGERARRRAVQCYDWSVVVRAYEELWRELIDAGRGAADDEPGFGVTSYDYRQVFGHYASRLDSPDAAVRLLDASPVWLPLLSARERRMWRWLIEDESRPEQTLRELTMRVSAATGVHHTAASRFLARCLKYGAIATAAAIEHEEIIP